MRIYIFLLIGVLFFSNEISAQEYKIMTYNIRYDNPHDGENQWASRKEFLSGQISFYESDIFRIQERLVHQVKYLKAA